MASEIKLSVIVPIYNTEDYLEGCLSSIVHQTLNNLEIILINDGSTDKSVEILEEYYQRFPKLIRIIHKENSGQASARNLGIDMASGKYIGFVDSDDVIKPDMFRMMYFQAEKVSADMIECDYQYCKSQNGEDVAIKRYGTVKKRFTVDELFIDPLVSPWNKIFRRDILIESGIRFPDGLIYEDTAFYIELIPWIKKIAFVPNDLVVHYARKNSTQTQIDNPKLSHMLSIVEHIINYYKSNNYWAKYQQELEYFCIKILLGSSLGRVSLLSNKEEMNLIIEGTWSLIEKHFPGFRKNKYIKWDLQGIYLKSCSRKTLPFLVNYVGKYYNWKMS